jgi:hypothetical protein
MGIGFLDDSDHPDLAPRVMVDRNSGPGMVNPKVALAQRMKDAGQGGPTPVSAPGPTPGSQAGFSGYGTTRRAKPVPPASMNP